MLLFRFVCLAMITIGLLGGVASGKSAVARDFQRLGATILDGDRAGHEVLQAESVREQLTSRWGNEILTTEGTLDRSAIAKKVFASPQSKSKVKQQAKVELAYLESVTHPEIGRLLASRLAKIREAGRHLATVLDAAIMLKAGWDTLCDKIVFVDAPEALRRKRAQLRGLSNEQFDAREASQTSLAEKRKRAHFTIDNSGPPQNTFQQVEKVWQELLQIT